MTVSADNSNVEIIGNVDTDSAGVLNYAESRDTHSASSSITSDIAKQNKASFEIRKNTATSSESVYFHKFLEINCSYLCPNDLDDSFLARDNSEFIIFHNNANSLCSADTNKFSKLKSVFTPRQRGVL